MCDSTSKRLCNNSDCEKCFERSFASHERSKYWSKKNELSARDVFKNSNKKYIFDCGECGHEFNKSLNNISNGQWCRYCNKGELCDCTDCESCFKKSFATHPMSVSWSSRNTKSPREYSLGSESKCWFKCTDCDHEFEIKLYSIKSEKVCIYCSNQKLCEDEECIMCCSKSCASSELICKCWSTKNSFQPRDVMLHSHKKVFINCDTCKNEIYVMIDKFVSADGCCSFCRNKTEAKMLEFLNISYTDIIPQARFDWCINTETSQRMPFDFTLEKFKVIIEIDGIQHFEQVAKWKTPIETQTKDIKKIIESIKNGYSIIHIYQPFIWNNTIDWKNDILNEINYLNSDIKNKKCIFIGPPNIYNNHISAIKDKCEILVREYSSS